MINVWAEDADEDAESVEIDFLEYRNDGYWDFPTKRKVMTINVKFLFLGPCRPESCSTKGYSFSEDKDSLSLYQRVKKLYRSITIEE